MSGIICKVWNIKGSSSKKSSNAQISDSLKYILNDEKTGAIIQSDESSSDFISKQLGRECKYIENDIKTMEGAYVGCINLSSANISDAVKDMITIKKFYGKEDGRAALHGIISLPEEESNPENIPKLMALCDSVLRELFPEHQAVYAVHTNTENLHVHFVVNSVGLNGRKIHQPKGYIDNVVQPCINKYAEIYGFNQNEKWKENKTYDGGKTKFVEHKIYLRRQIDHAIECSNDFEEFLEILKDEDITVNVGKHISLLYGDMRKPIRSYQLGDEYTKDSIIERIRIKSEALADFHFYDSSNIDNVENQVSFDPAFQVMKRYKDMSPEERKDVIKQLKTGVNPWKRHYNTSWQMKEIADDLNLSSRIQGYVKKYSSNGSCDGALAGILEIKKQILQEKKEADQLYKKYKSLIKIHDEMEVLEKKAYLYEHEGITSYRSEYDQYRELTRRLRDNYGRTFEEVSDFKERYQNQKLYAEAQLEELSLEYREIKKYSDSHGLSKERGTSLYDFIGIEKDKEYVKYGSFEFEKNYYVSNKNPDVIVCVEKTPEMNDKGRMVEQYQVSVMTRSGKVLRTFDSRDGIGSFKKSLFDVEKFYGLKDCREFSSLRYAMEYVDVSAREIKKSFGKDVDEPKEIKTFSFTQAVNMLNPDDENDQYVISDLSITEYMVVVSFDKNKQINLVIVDAKGRMQEQVSVPSVDKKNKDGWNTLKILKDKYGFGDRMAVFSTLDDARERKSEYQRDFDRRRK